MIAMEKQFSVVRMASNSKARSMDLWRRARYQELGPICPTARFTLPTS